jgi:hypothetical protein
MDQAHALRLFGIPIFPNWYDDTVGSSKSNLPISNCGSASKQEKSPALTNRIVANEAPHLTDILTSDQPTALQRASSMRVPQGSSRLVVVNMHFESRIQASIEGSCWTRTKRVSPLRFSSALLADLDIRPVAVAAPLCSMLFVKADL